MRARANAPMRTTRPPHLKHCLRKGKTLHGSAINQLLIIAKSQDFFGDSYYAERGIVTLIA